MNVGELKKLLEQYPDDMEVIQEIYSDYGMVGEGDFSVVKAVPKQGWIMRDHPTMSQENKLAAREYLCIAGN
jgi:hypothetical protein